MTTVNGEEVIYHPTLAAAIDYALAHGEAYLTIKQAEQFANTRRLTDNEGQILELWRSIIDDEHDNGEALADDHYCFTVVTEDDIDYDENGLTELLCDDDRFYRVVYNERHCEDIDENSQTCIDRLAPSKCNYCLARYSYISESSK